MQIQWLKRFLLQFGWYRTYRDRQAYKILSGTRYSEDEQRRIRRNHLRDGAKLAIKSLRNTKINRNADVGITPMHLESINKALEAGWSYEDIETSADELVFFRNEECYKDAFRKRLENARRDPADEGFGVLGGVELLEHLGLTPQDFGTSFEEMRELWWQADRASALKYVTKLREIAKGALPILPYNNPQQTYETLCNNLLHQPGRDFGLGTVRPVTFADVDTSQTELEQLLQEGKRRWADADAH